MKRYKITILAIIVIVSAISLSTFVFAASKEPAKDSFVGIWNAINNLRQAIKNIRLVPGPKGPAGPQGIQGPMGPQGIQGPTGPQGPTSSQVVGPTCNTAGSTGVAAYPTIEYQLLESIDACTFKKLGADGWRAIELGNITNFYGFKSDCRTSGAYNGIDFGIFSREKILPNQQSPSCNSILPPQILPLKSLQPNPNDPNSSL